MGKNELKKRKKRNDLLKSAYELFTTVGFSKTTIDNIAAKADVGKGTFYLYFKDKSDLLEQIIMYKSMESIKRLLYATSQRIKEENLPFTEICKLFIDNYIDFLVMNKDILGVLQKNISSCLKVLPNLGDEEIARCYYEILEKFIEFGYDRENAQKTMYIVIDLVGSVCSDAILHDKPFSIDEIRDNVKTAALNIIEYRK